MDQTFWMVNFTKKLVLDPADVIEEYLQHRSLTEAAISQNFGKVVYYL